MPAQFLADPREPRDAWQYRGGEPGFRPADRRDVDANAADAGSVQIGQLPVAGVVLVEIDDAAPDRRIEPAHRIEHAGVVEAISTRLHEYIAHESDAARQFEIALDRLVGRLVADVAAVGIFLGRTEHVKMCIAGVGRGGKDRLKTGIRIVLCNFVHGLSRGLVEGYRKALMRQGRGAGPGGRLDRRPYGNAEFDTQLRDDAERRQLRTGDEQALAPWRHRRSRQFEHLILGDRPEFRGGLAEEAVQGLDLDAG